MAYYVVKNIFKSYGKNEVLKGINFDLEKGQVLSIIGRSGCGKTTLLRCLNYLESINEGEIYLEDLESYVNKYHNNTSDKKYNTNYEPKKRISDIINNSPFENVNKICLSIFI